MDIKRTEVPGFPPGWYREESIRKSGLLAGKSDICYVSPSGERCYSKHDISRYLGDRFDLNSFDFVSGRFMQSVLRRNKNAKTGNLADTHKVSQTDSGIVLPIRQTASIFKQPVTVVRSHPDSLTNKELKHGPQEPPQQVFWQKRLQGLVAADTNCEPLKQFDLPSKIQLATMDLTSQGVLQGIAAALHFYNRTIVGQSASQQALSKNFAANVNIEQPLIQKMTISDHDVQRQELRVAEARKRLQAAVSTYNSMKIRKIEAS